MIITQILLVLDLLLSILVISPKLPIWFGHKKSIPRSLGQTKLMGCAGIFELLQPDEFHGWFNSLDEG